MGLKNKINSYLFKASNARDRTRGAFLGTNTFKALKIGGMAFPIGAIAMHIICFCANALKKQ
jgi:hypothetical protein